MLRSQRAADEELVEQVAEQSGFKMNWPSNGSAETSLPFRPITRDQDSETSNSTDSEYDNDSGSDDALNWKRRKTQSRFPADSAAFVSSPHMEFSHSAPGALNNGIPQKGVTDKFNIWSNVLLEQNLVADINSFGVKKRVNNERGCEGYDYTLKFECGKPVPMDQQDSCGLHRRLGCKRTVKERLGSLSVLKKNKRSFDVNEDDTEETVINAIVTILREQKSELIARTVKILGKKKTLEVLQMTEDIEEAGGMMTLDGSRRRTAGGVYLFLIRHDDCIPTEAKNMIFEEEKKIQTQAKKEIIKARRRKIAQAKGCLKGDDHALKPLPTLADLLINKEALEHMQCKEMPENEEQTLVDVKSETDSDRESGELQTDDSE